MIKFVIIYLSGFIVNYILIKFTTISINEEIWTKRKRNTLIFFSFWSWLLFPSIIYNIIKHNSSDELSN